MNLNRALQRIIMELEDLKDACRNVHDIDAIEIPLSQLKQINLSEPLL